MSEFQADPFILAPLNEETLFRGIMLNVFRSSIGIKTPKRLKKHHKTDV
ncbi:CPBP family intramembrane metalloprotease, partial [Shigella dysenteriae]